MLHGLRHGLRFGEEAGARKHMPYAFSGKVAAAGGETYLVCAVVAVWIVSSAIGYSLVGVLCNAGMQIALQFFGALAPRIRFWSCNFWRPCA